MFNPCVLIPVYDHEHAIGAVVESVLGHGMHCILVDDGSSASCARVLGELAAGAPAQITLVRHALNQGKGAAVLTGFSEAAKLGYSHLLQIDSDGQHAASDIPRFVALARAHPDAVIAGCPLYDHSVPRIRLYCRYLTHWLVWLNTLSFEIRDTMCGFRVYPVAPLLALARRQALGKRMNFDIEVLVRLHWAGIKVVNVPTRVTYPSDGVSHFMQLKDNALITRLHITLLCGMLVRLPMLLARKWRAR